MSEQNLNENQAPVAAKKTIYKNWWFWVIIVLLVGAIGAGVGGNTSTENKTDNTSISTTKSNVKVEVETTIAKETKKATETTDELLWNKSGVKIYYTGIDENALGKAICLRIENDSKQKWTVQNEDLSINGFMIYGILSADVEKGKKMNTDITILDSDLENNGIDEIEDISLKLKLVDLDNFDNKGFESSIINIKVK